MRNQIVTTENMPDHLAEYSSYLREEKMRARRTISCYVDVVNEFRSFIAGSPSGAVRSVETVRKTEIVEFLRATSKGHGEPSRATWNIRLAALRSFYGYLFKNEFIEKNPTQLVDRHRINLNEPIPLSPEEYFDLLDALETASPAYRARDLAIAAVLFHTGMRVSELVSVNVDQVDFKNHLLLNVRLKGRKRRTKRMNDLLAAALEAYLAERHRLEPASGEAALFISDRGTRMSVRAVQELVKAYGKLAGISRPITPHILRHSSASVLSDLGVPLRHIQEHLDHESMRTTERYTHVRDREQWVVDELGEHIAKLAERRRKGGDRRKRIARRVAAYSASNRN